MAYVVTNPPVLMTQVHPAGRRVWIYESADASTVVDASNYFTNGAVAVSGAGPLGMKNQDLCYVMDTDTGLTTLHQVMVASGVVDLTDATVMTTVTTSD